MRTHHGPVAYGATVLVTLSAALALVACGQGEQRPGMVSPDGELESGSTERPAFSKLAADTVVDVTVAPDTIRAARTTIPAGRIYFAVKRDRGGRTDLAVTASGAQDDEGTIAQVAAIDTRRPRGLALELRPGRYQLASFGEGGSQPITQAITVTAHD